MAGAKNWWHTTSHYFGQIKCKKRVNLNSDRKIITPSIQYGPLFYLQKLWATPFWPGSSLVFLQAWNRSFKISEFFFIIEEAPGACLDQRVREVDGWHLKHPTNYKNTSTTDYTQKIRFGGIRRLGWLFVKIWLTLYQNWSAFYQNLMAQTVRVWQYQKSLILM